MLKLSNGWKPYGLKEMILRSGEDRAGRVVEDKERAQGKGTRMKLAEVKGLSLLEWVSGVAFGQIRLRYGAQHARLQ